MVEHHENKTWITWKSKGVRAIVTMMYINISIEIYKHRSSGTNINLGRIITIMVTRAM